MIFWEKTMTIPSIDKDIEQLEHLYIAHGDAKWYSHSGKRVGSFFSKVKQTLMHDLAIPLLGICPEDMKTHVYTVTCTCPKNRDNICKSHNWQGTGLQAT